MVFAEEAERRQRNTSKQTPSNKFTKLWSRKFLCRLEIFFKPIGKTSRANGETFCDERVRQMQEHTTVDELADRMKRIGCDRNKFRHNPRQWLGIVGVH